MAASTSVSFSIAQIRNPRSAKTVTGITVSTQNGNGNDIDSKSDVTLTGINTARSFSTTALNLAGSTQVGQNSVMQIFVSLDIPVDSGAYVILTYPNDLTLSAQPITNLLGSGSYSDPASVSDSG